jgi:signal transduction histidine kinase
VAKHAKANHVSVTVDELDDGTIRLRVRDDGVGFDTSNGAQLLRGRRTHDQDRRPLAG